jgi:hypothetical protein
MLFCLRLMLPPAGDTILASFSDEAAFRRVETKRHRASPRDTACIEPVIFTCFRKEQLIRVKNHYHARDVRFL